jgi:hypothetical protein
VLGIGFGARPWRFIWLINLVADAIGFDLEYPALHGWPNEFLNILRKNGIERCLKTLVRFFLFDPTERRESKRLIGADSASPLAMPRVASRLGMLQMAIYGVRA